MSRKYPLFILPLILAGGFSFVVTATALDDQTSGLNFSLAAWKDDKPAAFIICSDDSMVRSIKSQWKLENPDVPYDGFYTLGKTYDIPVTFFIVPRLMDDAVSGNSTHVYYSSLYPPSINPGAGGSWDDWKFMHDQGHEIASHTYSHTDFRPGPDKKPSSSVNPHFECGEAVRSIASHIGEKPLSMNFPYGTPTKAVLEVARHYTPLTDEDFSSDLANVRKAVYGSDSDAQDLIMEMKLALDEGQCLILGGHGIRTGLGQQEEAALDFKEHGIRWDGYRPVDFAALEGLFHYLDLNRERIYIDVFKNVSRYLAQRKASTLKIRSREDGEILLELTHNLDPELYNVPLTLRIDSQHDASEISVYQDGKVVPVKSRGQVFLADVVPNGGSIKIASHR